MIDTRIDWCGYAGDVGRVYVIGWDDDDELKKGKYCVRKTSMVVPPEECLKIAKKQLEGGGIKEEEYNKIVSKIMQASQNG